MDQRLQAIIDRIQPPDVEAEEEARRRQDALTKPRGSMGRLEAVSIQIAGIRRQAMPQVAHKVIITMAGDHGVVAEGVSAYPQEVTQQMVLNFLRGGAAINVLAHHVGARVVVVDMGIAADMPAYPGLVIMKVAPGTGNIAHGPAMSQEQAVLALLAGIQVVGQEVAVGLDIVGIGEMGIGNTTPSAAIASAMTGLPVTDFCGRGTGVDDRGLACKVDAVQRALAVNRPDPRDALDVLAKVGAMRSAASLGSSWALRRTGGRW